jgi:MFS family permease
MNTVIDISSRRAWYILAVIIIATFAASINRQILFLIIEPLKLEMSLSDADIGILTGLAPGLLAGTGALLLGWLTDRTPRHLLLGICILIWSVATAGLGIAFTFVGFLFGVLALALGETVVSPVANSLMPDVFAGRRRVLANLIFFAAGGIAVGMGAAASGSLLNWVQLNETLLPSVLQSLTYWRSAFMIVAAAGIPVALLAFTIGHIRRRSAGDKNFNDYTSLQHYAREHGVAAIGLYTAIAFTSFGGLAVMSWTPSYVIRVFEVTPAQAGFALGISATIGGLSGVAIAALLISKMFSRYGSLAPRHLYKYSMLLIIVPAMLQLLASNATHAYILYGVQIMFANLGTALSSTMIQDISPAKYRGRLFGISVLLITVVSSVAPFVVGLISDQFGAEPRGLLWAMLLVVVPALILSALSISLTNKQYKITAANLAIN